MKILAVAGAAVWVAGPAFAHPDHSIDPGLGLAHVVSDPFHLSLMALSLSLMALAAALVCGAGHAMRRLAR